MMLGRERFECKVSSMSRITDMQECMQLGNRYFEYGGVVDWTGRKREGTAENFLGTQSMVTGAAV